MKKPLRLAAILMSVLMLLGSMTVTAYAYQSRGSITLSSSAVLLEVGETAELTVTEKEFEFIGNTNPTGWRSFEVWRTLNPSVVDFTDEFIETYPSNYYTAVPYFPYAKYPVDRQYQDYTLDKTAEIVGVSPGVGYVVAQCHEWDSYVVADVCEVTVYRKGDLDGDNNVLSYDALMALKASLGLIEPSKLALAAGKMTATDGDLTTDDALGVLNAAVGATGELTADEYAGIYNAVNYEKPFVPGEVIVCFKDATSIEYPLAGQLQQSEIESVEDGYKTVIDRALADNPELEIPALITEQISKLYRIKLAAGTRKSVIDAIELLKSDPNVLYAIPAYADTFYDSGIDGELAQSICDGYREFFSGEFGREYIGTIKIDMYFGKYSGHDVVVISAPDARPFISKAKSYDIEGFEFINYRMPDFTHPNYTCCTGLLVRNGSSFMMLEDAYAEGWITQADIGEICEKYNESSHIEYSVPMALDALRIAVDIKGAAADDMFLYDMNGDISITVEDALAILRTSIGIQDE